MNDKKSGDKQGKGKQPLWYVRGNDKINGPYPSGAMRRFLLLGRISLEEEISKDRETWCKVAAVPEVIPPEVRRAMQEGTVDELLAASRREDERSGKERRTAADDIKYKERRKGERRRNEDAVKKRRREARRALLEASQKRKLPLATLVISLAVLLPLIGYGLFWEGGPTEPEPDCTAQPGPGVNWRNCSLSGLRAKGADLSGAVMNNARLGGALLSRSNLSQGDLQYVDFNSADLSYAQLNGANLKGSNLQNADLSYANLSASDLSFANLSGANPGGADLSGARFDEAIWFDGSRCMPGSVGRCVRPTGK